MSIYASVEGLGDPGDDESVGPPWIYRGSHILPADTDPRGGTVDLAVIPRTSPATAATTNPKTASAGPGCGSPSTYPATTPPSSSTPPKPATSATSSTAG